MAKKKAVKVVYPTMPCQRGVRRNPRSPGYPVIEVDKATDDGIQSVEEAKVDAHAADDHTGGEEVTGGDKPQPDG